MSDRMDDVLTGIDETLEYWHGSPNSARWTPPEDRKEGSSSSYHNPRTISIDVSFDLRGFIQAMERVGVGFSALQESLKAFRRTEALTPQEFRARALEHQQTRNTGPQRPDNRRWRNK